MIIRRWERSDNAAVSVIENKSFSDPWSVEMLDSCFLSPAFYGLVAVDNGLIAGFIGSMYLFENGDIINVCVDEAYRRRGVGQALIGQLLAYLKERGVERVLLEVRKSNLPAIKLYEKLGFTLSGERKKYYEDTEDALIYKMEL